jgi:O-antigen/teichoic acid export membrane protein
MLRTEVERIDLEKLSHQHRPSLIINAISNWGPLSVNIAIGFLLTPYLIAHLGKENYGIWVLVGSLLGYYGLLRLGVGAGIMRYVPFYIGRDDSKSTSEVVSTGLTMFLLVGLVIFAVSMLVAEPITRFYKSGPELAFLVRILGTAAAFGCPMYILDACIRAREHWIAANCVTIASAVARAIGLACCVYFGYTIIEMGYVVLAVTVFSMVLTCMVFGQSCRGIYLRPSLVKLSRAKTLISFGVLTTITALAHTLTLQGHSLIIGKVISLEAVAIYAVAVMLIRNVRNLSIAPARVFWPRFAYLDGRNHCGEVASLFIRGTRFTAVFGSGIMLILFTLGPCFIRLWVGEDFQAAYPVVLFLAAGYLIECSQAIMSPFLGGTGRQGIQAIFAAVEGVIGIGLGILLAWRLGLVGTALGFVISIVLIRGLICPWFVCRLLNIRTIQYYINCLLRPWLILGTLTLLASYSGIEELVHNWIRFISAAVMIGVVYIICAYYIVMSDEERERMKYYVRKLFVRMSIRAGIKE